MTYLTGGIIGVDLTALTAGTTTDGVNAVFTLGERHHGSDGTEWVYVQASGAITQYDCVAIDENYQAAPITDALASQAHMIGFAQVAFSDNDLGWVAVRGSNISVNVLASCDGNAQLWNTGTAGSLDDASSAGASKIDGVVIVSTISTSATSAEIIATWPVVRGA